MFELKDLRGGYSKKTVFQGVSLCAQQGKMTVILGPNGCGKSTLMKSICGILPVTGGQILLNDMDLLSLSANSLAQKVAYLAQSKSVPEISVKRLVLHGRFPYLTYPRRYKKEDYAIADEMIERLNLTAYSETSLYELSGGQQQKAYLAMALAQDTEIILLDEPTSHLDISHQLQTLRLVKNLAQTGKYFLVVLHDIEQALRFADQILVMNEGRIIVQGSPQEVYESGQLDKVFHIRVTRILVENEWRYLCTDL